MCVCVCLCVCVKCWCVKWRSARSTSEGLSLQPNDDCTIWCQKTRRGFLSGLLRRYSHRWKITCSLIKPISDKPIVSSTIPWSLLNLSISALLGGEMSVLSTMSFHLRIRAFFSPSNPQTEPIESSSQTAIRKALEPRLKMEISWNIKYSP